MWGAHLAWSGNSRVSAERLPDGRRRAPAGELLRPGEVVLAPGEAYRTPPVYAVHSPAGLNVASRAVPRRRARPAPPAAPRPVLVNTWEAVYFDHDLDTLRGLADAGGRGRGRAVRARRRVVRRPPRRHSAGLGDWWVVTGRPPGRSRALIERRPRRSAWSSGCGSSRRWSTPTATSTAPTRTGRWSTPATSRCSARNQLVLDLDPPTRTPTVLGRLDALLARPRHRLPQVGHEPRPRRGQRRRRPRRHPRPDARRVRLIDELRDATPAWRSRAARRAGGGSTSASSTAPNGCGRATATTRWSARPSSAGRRRWSRRE